MASNPRYGDVALLLPCDGANNSTTFTDYSLSAKTVSAMGNAKISTAQSKFGGASALFDGASYLSVEHSTDFALGNKDFCIELWLRMAALPESGQYVVLMSKRYSASFANSFTLWYAGTEKFYFSHSVGGSTQISSATLNDTVLVAGQWYHVAFVRHAGAVKVYVDGVAGAGVHNIGADSIYAGGTEPIRIGAANYSPTYYLSGNLDDIQITIGSPVYTEDFTPPAAPHPTSAPSFSGTVEGADGEPAARLIRAMREDTGAFAGETTSSGTTGAYTITVPYGGEHTLTAYPAAGENLPALTLRGMVPV